MEIQIYESNNSGSRRCDVLRTPSLGRLLQHLEATINTPSSPQAGLWSAIRAPRPYLCIKCRQDCNANITNCTKLTVEVIVIQIYAHQSS